MRNSPYSDFDGIIVNRGFEEFFFVPWDCDVDESLKDFKEAFEDIHEAVYFLFGIPEHDNVGGWHKILLQLDKASTPAAMNDMGMDEVIRRLAHMLLNGAINVYGVPYNPGGMDWAH